MGSAFATSRSLAFDSWNDNLPLVLLRDSFASQPGHHPRWLSVGSIRGPALTQSFRRHLPKVVESVQCKTESTRAPSGYRGEASPSCPRLPEVFQTIDDAPHTCPRTPKTDAITIGRATSALKEQLLAHRRRISLLLPVGKP